MATFDVSYAGNAPPGGVKTFAFMAAGMGQHRRYLNFGKDKNLRALNSNAGPAQGDVLQVITVLKMMRVFNVAAVAHEAPTGLTAVNVGDGASATQFITGWNPSTTREVASANTGDKMYTADDKIQIVLTTASQNLLQGRIEITLAGFHLAESRQLPFDQGGI